MMKKHFVHDFADVSPRAERLLEREEGMDVEFKETLTALDPMDIAAFANAPHGGTILVGIRDTMQQDGRQKGVIIGLRVGDKSKMIITSKVSAIVPQIDVEIFVENAAHRPFYRIEIPPCPDKPYCTANGTYKIRDDGYARPLLPPALLNLYLERESRRFTDRFEAAARGLEDEVLSIRGRMSHELNYFDESMRALNLKTDAMIKHLGIADPLAERQKEQARKVEEMLRKAGAFDEKEIADLVRRIFDGEEQPRQENA